MANYVIFACYNYSYTTVNNTVNKSNFFENDKVDHCIISTLVTCVKGMMIAFMCCSIECQKFKYYVSINN